MIIKVCVGSSCHLKGSYDVVEALKDLLKKYEVEDAIELQACFCVGNCAKGVSVLAEEFGDKHPQETPTATPIEDGLLLHQVTAENAEAIFVEHVLPLLK